ncbi:50S ribosomal protein L15 [Candidatus Curtissbacteria bacterium RBG_13_35_7]|uniref:Large ribosomal subunit protein uL15 n=1 Tax=Candidatus Curtissbacteria bacterium RBG_13_35_7 TaxID=1797705 RepID=A0A1F5G0S3_9BACT|nr:MAG: 50S ribosomal protein L15 [Candidatus Curtissbacteria bacterium RBG_13_35_7]
MKLQNLSIIKSKSSKRLGRGPGSGKGKTSGRGMKGQKARNKLSIYHSHYEGGQRPIFKRLPYRRGKGNSKISKKPIIINLDVINLLPKNQIVNLESLIKNRIVDKDDAKKYGVKILGNGKLNSAYTFDVITSKSAVQKIQKAGGKVIIPDQKIKITENQKTKINNINNSNKSNKVEKNLKKAK